MDGFNSAGPTAAIFGSTGQQETLVAKYTRGDVKSAQVLIREMNSVSLPNESEINPIYYLQNMFHSV